MTTPAVHSVVVWARSLAAALQDAPGILPDFTIIGLCAVVLCLLLLTNTHPPPIATLARSSHCTGSKHGDTSHWNLSLKKTRQCLSRSISNVGWGGYLSSCQTWLFFNIEFPEDQRLHDPNAWLRGEDTDSHDYGHGCHRHTHPLPPEVLLLSSSQTNRGRAGGADCETTIPHLNHHSQPPTLLPSNFSSFLSTCLSFPITSLLL